MFPGNSEIRLLFSEKMISPNHGFVWQNYWFSKGSLHPRTHLRTYLPTSLPTNLPTNQPPLGRQPAVARERFLCIDFAKYRHEGKGSCFFIYLYIYIYILTLLSMGMRAKDRCFDILALPKIGMRSKDRFWYIDFAEYRVEGKWSWARAWPWPGPMARARAPPGGRNDWRSFAFMPILSKVNT